MFYEGENIDKRERSSQEKISIIRCLLQQIVIICKIKHQQTTQTIERASWNMKQDLRTPCQRLMEV